MFRLSSEGEGIIPKGKRAADFDRVAAFVRATSFGLILPHIFYVNDLSHPFQTGLLFFLFPLGIFGGCLVFGVEAERSIVREVLSTLIYLSVAVTAIWRPEGVAGLRIFQLALFLLGFLAGNPRSLAGVSIGALLSAALTWNCVRSPERYALAEMAMPAVAAAILSAITVALAGGRRRSTVIAESPRNREAVREIGMSAFTALSAAIVCTLTPMMMWESFGFTGGATALMFAKAGLVILCIKFMVGRALSGRLGLAHWAYAFGWAALALLAVGAGALMWSPWTQSGWQLFTGLAAFSIGWGCWQAARLKLPPGGFAGKPHAADLLLNNRAVLVAWTVGPILSASVFYAHERTSFGLAGVAIVLAAIILASMFRKSEIRAGRQG
jgi:hypothetical protein